MGIFYHYDGVSWQNIGFASAQRISDIHGTAEDNLYSVFTDGSIYHYDGQTWEMMASGNSIWLEAVACRSDNEVVAGGWYGAILHDEGSEEPPVPAVGWIGLFLLTLFATFVVLPRPRRADYPRAEQE